MYGLVVVFPFIRRFFVIELTMPFLMLTSQCLTDFLQQEKLDEPKPLPDEFQETNSVVVDENKLQTADIILCTNVPPPNEILHPSTSTEFTSDIVDINETLSAADMVEKQKFNESTPSNRKTVMKKELFAKRMTNYGSSSVMPPSKRQLFTPTNGTTTAIRPIHKRMKFTLTAIHERMFGTEPNQSHYAESDALALLKCAVASKMEFIEYAEENASFFKDIKPIGS